MTALAWIRTDGCRAPRAVDELGLDKAAQRSCERLDVLVWQARGGEAKTCACFFFLICVNILGCNLAPRVRHQNRKILLFL